MNQWIEETILSKEFIILLVYLKLLVFKEKIHTVLQKSGIQKVQKYKEL